MGQDENNLQFKMPVAIMDVKPGMTLADDIFTQESTMYIKRDTVLTNSIIEKLKLNNTECVMVKSDEEWHFDKYSAVPHASVFYANDIAFDPAHYAAVPVEEQIEFKNFEKNYGTANVDVKKCILAISDGAEIKLDQLFKLTDGIMNKLNSKNDVLTFLASIRSTDEHTFTHSNNVSLLCNLFSRWLGYGESDTLYLTVAGLLHDIGKTKMPLEVLNKKGKLTKIEFETIKTHTVLGYRILENHDIPKPIKLSALMHHEKINGKGYPLGTAGDKIDNYAKIVSICDIYDAMTANRVYRKKLCPFEVIRTFERRVYGELDTEFLLVFLSNIAATYLNCPVKLSDGRVGTVVFINKFNLSNPIVKLTDGNVLDLSYINDLYVSEIYENLETPTENDGEAGA